MFPVFAGCDNRLSYVLRSTVAPLPKDILRFAGKGILKRGPRLPLPVLGRFFREAVTGIELNFRGAFFSREGKLLAEVPQFARLRHLQAFDISLNELQRAAGLPNEDAQFLMIADRGIKLGPGFSTGTLTATYFNDRTFACYRNSIFARPVNEFSHHRPVGFRSIAPQVVVTEEIESSAFFCNFSSDHRYDFTANPTARLYRGKEDFLEASFGAIAPQGGVERSITDIFGDAAIDFLRPAGGYGTLIASQNGVTLTSIHLLRNRRTGSMSIEHSRPTHSYVT